MFCKSVLYSKCVLPFCVIRGYLSILFNRVNNLSKDRTKCVLSVCTVVKLMLIK